VSLAPFLSLTVVIFSFLGVYSSVKHYHSTLLGINDVGGVYFWTLYFKIAICLKECNCNCKQLQSDSLHPGQIKGKGPEK
jgi:hypothetical protein